MPPTDDCIPVHLTFAQPMHGWTWMACGKAFHFVHRNNKTSQKHLPRHIASHMKRCTRCRAMKRLSAREHVVDRFIPAATEGGTLTYTISTEAMNAKA